MNLRFNVEDDSPGMMATRGLGMIMKQMGQDGMVLVGVARIQLLLHCVLTSSFNVFLK
jgi:hypothetical protein